MSPKRSARRYLFKFKNLLKDLLTDYYGFTKIKSTKIKLINWILWHAYSFCYFSIIYCIFRETSIILDESIWLSEVK